MPDREPTTERTPRARDGVEEPPLSAEDPQDPGKRGEPDDRPVAVAGDRPWGEWGDDLPASEPGMGEIPPPGEPPGAPAEERPEIEHPLEETLLGIASIALALSVLLLPWYKGFGTFEITGWASGTWGPVVFFLALAALAIVVLRRVGVPLSFPVPGPLVLEAIGWVSVAAILLKRWFRAEYPPGSDLGVGIGLWVGLVCAGAIALLGGRVSRDVPIVVRPGWQRGRAGMLSIAIILVAVGAGAAFGLTNSFAPEIPRATQGGENVPKPEKGFPKCMTDAGITVPKDVTPDQGLAFPGQQTICTAQLSTKLSVTKAAGAFRDRLDEGGWDVTKSQSAKGLRAYTLKKAAQCGTLQVQRLGDAKSTSITLFFTLCPPATASPSR